MHNSEHETDAGSQPAWRIPTLPYLHILTIIVIAVACYSNTFQVPMLLDDEGSIQLHVPVHGLANYFRNWAGYNFLPNRAFGYLTFALNYEFGGLNVTGYHVVNLLIHTCTALLVYALLLLTFRTPHLRDGSDRIKPEARIFAFVVALLFVSHPIQTQAVTYIVQRLTSMTAMFYLAALVCYARWRLTLADTARSSAWQGIGWYLLSLLATILAMKTKEISVTLPLMLLIYECSFFGLPGRRLLVKMAPLLLTIILIPVTRILHVVPVLTSSAGTGAFISDNPVPSFSVERFTRWDYLYTQFRVIVTYLRLLFFPVNQNLDYDYPLNHSLFEPRAFLPLLLLLSIFLMAVYMQVKSTQLSRQSVPGGDRPETSFPTSHLLRLASFGIFWFFITLSVESSVIKIQDVIYEHRLYLPSFGFFLSVTALAALCLVRLKERFRWLPNAAAVVTAGTILTLSMATYARNHVWRDWITLWSDNVAKSPNKPRPHNILGIGYFYRGNFNKAMQQYQEAIRLKPDYIEVYYNMGLIYKAKKEHKEAITMYLKVLGMSAFNNEQFAKTYNEIGINYAELGNPDQAIKAFGESVELNPDSTEYRNNYAYALWMNGRLDDALREYLTVLKQNPGDGYAMAAVQEIKASLNKL